MNRGFSLKSIGMIRTPYHDHRDIPIQGRFKPGAEGCLELEKKYQPGLMDLEGFSHAIVLYIFHGSNGATLTGRPFLENCPHGIFAIRSPHRPNHLGLSVIKIESIRDNILRFTNVDMLDGTPLLDIKPYVTHFDSFPDAVSGWTDRHFEGGRTPAAAKNKLK